MRFLACFVRKGGERVIEVGGRFELRLDGILEARVASGDWCIRTVLPSCGNVVILLLVLLPDLAIVNASRSLHNLLLKIIVCMRFIEPLWSYGFHQHSPLTANCLVKNRQIGLDLPQLNRDIYGLVKKWKLSDEESKAVGGGWRRNEGVRGGLGGTEAEQSEQSEPQRFHGIGKASHDVLRVHRELGGLVKIDFPIFDDQQFTTSGSGCVIGGKDPQLMTDYDIVVANHDVIRTLHHIPFSDDDVIGLECQFDCGDIFHHFLDVIVDGVAIEVEPPKRQHVEGATQNGGYFADWQLKDRNEVRSLFIAALVLATRVGSRLRPLKQSDCPFTLAARRTSTKTATNLNWDIEIQFKVFRLHPISNANSNFETNYHSE